MNVVEKYGGTSVGTIEQIKAIAAHAAKCKARGDNLVLSLIHISEPTRP